MIIIYLLMALLGSMATIFALQNRDPVEIWFLTWSVRGMPLALVFVVFYFLLIRPQQKKAKEHKALLETLQKGDQVVTAGGIHGKVTAIEDAIAVVEVATGVNIRINKAFIASITKKA